MIPVVVGTNPERGHWLKDCIRSIRATSRHRRVHIHKTGGYELTALRAGVTRFKKFLFLHDSVEVLNPAFWEIIDTTPPAWIFGGPPMYMAVYDSAELVKALEDAPYGRDMTKVLSIYWEGELANRIQYPTLWPEVIDANGRLEEHHGRLNLVLENEFARKWKGNWGQP